MESNFHVTFTADLVPAKCRHGIEAGQCLSFDCLKHSNIPIRGEKSWDSALRPQSGGLFLNPSPWTFHWNSLIGTFPRVSQIQLSSPSWSPREAPPSEHRDLPVIGYRGWKVRQFTEGPKSIGPRVAALQTVTHIQLMSVNAQFGAWRADGPTVAHCMGGATHKAPDFNCECGLYVLSSLAAAPKWYAAHGVPDDVVVGAVVGWGDVIQHGDEGWRAEFARPIALLKTDVFGEQPLLHRAAEEYGLPILDRQGLGLYAREYGSELDRS